VCVLVGLRWPTPAFTHHPFRYHYLPAMVVAPVVALLSVQLPARTGMSRPVRVALAGGVLVLLFVLARYASRPWTNTVALYKNAQRFRNTNTGFALNNFGCVRLRLRVRAPVSRARCVRARACGRALRCLFRHRRWWWRSACFGYRRHCRQRCYCCCCRR
jgi:hypothetical protein